MTSINVTPQEFKYLKEQLTARMIQILTEEKGYSLEEAFERVYTSPIYEKLSDARTGLFFPISKICIILLRIKVIYQHNVMAKTSTRFSPFVFRCFRRMYISHAYFIIRVLVVMRCIYCWMRDFSSFSSWDWIGSLPARFCLSSGSVLKR